MKKYSLVTDLVGLAQILASAVADGTFLKRSGSSWVGAATAPPDAHTHAHADTTSQGTDDHHAESHTIVSHDTTATGANLNELTGAGPTVLHRHDAVGTKVPSGTDITIESNQVEDSHGPVQLDGGVILNGCWRLHRKPPQVTVTRLVGAETFDAPGGRHVEIPVDPTDGAATIRLPNRASPGDTAVVKNESDSTNPITVEGLGGCLDGAFSKVIDTGREHLTLRRGAGWDWSVVS